MTDIYGQLSDSVKEMKPVVSSSVKINSNAILFSNENMTGLDGLVNIEGKKVLGILGSTDFLIGAAAAGCSEYTAVDVSAYAFIFGELKLAALKNLTYEEFTRFYSDNPPEGPPKSALELLDSKPVHTAFDPTLYKKLRDDLSDTAKEFFDMALDGSFTGSWESAPAVFKYIEDERSRAGLKEIPYLRTEEDYYAAQEKASSPKKQVLMDFGKYMKETTEKFDIIYCSNVLDYFKQRNDISRHELVSLMLNALTEDGSIIFYDSSHTVDDLITAGFNVRKLGLEEISPVNGTFLTEAYVINAKDGRRHENGRRP